MFKYSKTIWFSCILLVIVACGNSDTSSSLAQSRSYDYVEENKSLFINDPAGDRFIIPPEIMIIGGRINASSSYFSQTTKLLDIGSKQIINSLTATEGCSAKITDYQYPKVRNSSKVILSDNDKYLGNMSLEILVAFTTSKDIEERIQQLNICMEAIPQLKVELDQEDKNTNIYLEILQIMPTIENAAKYRNTLLEHKFKPLKEVANISEPATQFNASDTKCTSNGIVKVVNYSLNGVELDIDFDCRRFVDGQLVPDQE